MNEKEKFGVKSDKTISSRKQIRDLLAVISTGVLFAFLLSFYMIYSYGPSGQYLAKNTLLAPQLIHSLSYTDIDSKTGKHSHFVFKEMEFSYFDPKLKLWQKTNIDPKTYGLFYTEISNEQSLLDVNDNMIQSFTKASPASLTLTVQTDTSPQTLTKVFQEVQFAHQGDYFRIQLHEQSPDRSQWIYFYHPAIYQKVLNQFLP